MLSSTLDKRGRVRTLHVPTPAGRSLRLRRTWYADDPNPTPEETPTPTPAGAQNTDEESKTVPYDRFKEVNTRAKKAEAELEKLRKAEEERKQAEALATGKHEEVIAALKPKAERVDALEATLKRYLDKEVEGIPENMRKLIPAGDVAAQLDWVQQAKSEGLFSRTPAPNLDAGESGDRKPAGAKLTPEQLDMARKSGMTEEQYVKAYGITRKPE